MPTMAMTVEDTRRANLRALADEVGGPIALARLVGVQGAQMSQWINGSPDSKTGKPRGLRPSSCRRIELAAGKPAGWLDRDHPSVKRQEPLIAQSVSPASVVITN